eukprot:CAMPEP_0194492256 /NCGR_PEP_ID=MMETSP0253-20130528/10878_1 /TAXON_ID=2966 /ORGANISM="Noctiluca scintillans" /LENGTH=193 /DNA_ID=CAMNT_0039333099 /DNA_START=113 /DNA_END=694 /DNA_ORIENTATION=+
MGVLMVAEIVIDKVRGMDQILHCFILIGSCFTSALVSWHPHHAPYLKFFDVALGMTLALIVQETRAGVRGFTISATGRFGNGVLSFFEDVLIIIFVSVVLFNPRLAPFALVLILVLVCGLAMCISRQPSERGPSQLQTSLSSTSAGNRRSHDVPEGGFGNEFAGGNHVPSYSPRALDSQALHHGKMTPEAPLA